MTSPVQGSYDEYSDDDRRPGVVARKRELVNARESGDLTKVKQSKSNLQRLMTALAQKRGQNAS